MRTRSWDGMVAASGRRAHPVAVRCLALVFVTLVAAAPSQSAIAADSAETGHFKTSAKQAFLIDAESGSTLFAHNADEPRPPASMSKLMTIALVFKALRAGKLKLSDEVTVSEDAWRRGGAPSRTSSMFVPVNTSATVEQMIRGLVIQSGNDAAIAVAEHLAGSEPAFAKLMDKEAQRLGMTRSTFGNASGLPDPRQLMSARDLVILARHLIYDYPEYYHYFSEEDFKYRRFRFINRNRLLFKKIGVDGLKTGHTENAGYGVVISAKRDGRRLIGVLGGLDSKSDRWAEAQGLIDWGFENFAELKVFDENEVIGQARVWGGSQLYVPLVGQGEVRVYLPRFPVNQRLKAQIIYQGPLKPPIVEGQQVAMLRVTSSTGAHGQVPLFAGETVQRGNLLRRGLDSLFYASVSWLR